MKMIRNERSSWVSITSTPTISFHFIIYFVDYNDDRTTAALTNFIKLRMHKFIFKVSEKTKETKSSTQSKWNVDVESFFNKVIYIYVYDIFMC